MKPFRLHSHVVISLVLAVAIASWLSRPLIAQVVATVESESTVTESAGELKTVAVVAAAHYEKLISDITVLGNLIGRPESGPMVEGALSFFTQGKAPEALDKTKPWGVIVQTDGQSFFPIGCLPVKGAGDVTDLATGYGAQVKEADQGVKEIVLPNQKSAFFKHQGGWAFFGLSADALKRVPNDPQPILGKLLTEYDLAASISMKDVPEMYRQFAVQAMQASMQQKLQKHTDESDEQFELRQKLAEAQVAQMTRTLNETDSITIGWAVDAANEQTHVDYTQTFLPGSKMAAQMAAYSEPRTNFAGFNRPDAAATFAFATDADPELIQQDIANIESTFDMLRAGFNRGVDDSSAKDPEAVKAAFSDWFDAMESTIRAGKIDGGASIHIDSDSLTIVAGAFVKDTAKVESGLKKLEAAAAARYPEFSGMEWNALTHAGVKFHTFSIPVPEEHQAPRKLLGSELDVAVGIGPEAVYVAIGQDSLESIKRAIDASAAEPGKAISPFELQAALGPLLDVAASQAEEGDEKAIAQAVADMLRDDSRGRDHIRVLGQAVPNGLRYRFEAEEGALKAIGAAANEAQRRALQARQ